VEGADHRRGAHCERRNARRRCHRLVQVHDVEAFARKRLLDPKDRPRTEDDVGKCSVRGHDHRTADRNHLGRRLAVPPVPWMQNACELARWIVAHDRAHVAPECGERLRLQLGMFHDAAPEGPRVRDDDAHLHRRHYRRAVRLRSEHDREILRLALPALGALAAEPLYLLADTAIVGHLGRPQIAALGLAGTVLAGAFTIFNFLTYGTTAVVARASGAGQQERAARLAAQALWVSLGIGVVVVIVCEAAAAPLLRGLGGHGRSGAYALTYFRIAALGLPAALVALAGQGYLRGVSNLRRPLVIVVAANLVNVVLELIFVYGLHWGIKGSAAGTAIAQAGMGAAFVVELLRPHAGSKRPSLREMKPMLRVGRQIFVRTTALYASFLVAASVCARLGDAELGAHQIASELFFFLALILDSVAIAGQVIVGRMLGAGDAEGARASALRMIAWSVFVGLVFALVFLPLAHVLPRAFTGDRAVLHQAALLWPFLALMQPLGGAVFALDGILIGAGDTSYLMWSMLGASAVFIALASLALALGWGIVGVWVALDVLIAVRLALLGARFAGGRWAVTGWS
jgi:putative MATE family efflux protein